MQRCLELASNGIGHTAPNPMVGAVIVCDNKVIGEGYHAQYGSNHAEVNAINSVKDVSALPDSTIYVSLEPCNHQGNTPPCTLAIKDAGIKKVVIGATDPNPAVNGSGIAALKEAGIEVVSGVLAEECDHLNKRFNCFHKHERPFVILKWAETKDGFMDKDRAKNEQGINWITGAETKKLVHKWRSEEQAILVGRTTVTIDNPELTVREVAGHSPTRVVLDPQLILNDEAKVFRGDVPTIILNSIRSESIGKNEFIQLEQFNPESILNALYQQGIQSVIIEGGRKTLDSFIDSGLWDDARVLVGDTYFESGLKAPTITGKPDQEFMAGSDQIRIYSNHRS